jgi:hypothetical protein
MFMVHVYYCISICRSYDRIKNVTLPTSHCHFCSQSWFPRMASRGSGPPRRGHDSDDNMERMPPYPQAPQRANSGILYFVCDAFVIILSYFLFHHSIYYTTDHSVDHNPLHDNTPFGSGKSVLPFFNSRSTRVIQLVASHMPAYCCCCYGGLLIDSSYRPVVLPELSFPYPSTYVNTHSGSSSSGLVNASSNSARRYGSATNQRFIRWSTGPNSHANTMYDYDLPSMCSFGSF